MNLADFDFALPEELVAQEPVEPRDAARLLVADAGDGEPSHRQVSDLPGLLRPGDLLVFNRTKVIPARLEARTSAGGAREVLLVHPEDGDPTAWRCLVRGRVREGQSLDLSGTPVQVERLHADGDRTLRFPAGCDILALADAHGAVPLPPYIRREARPDDRNRYQTVFADIPGSVAAPTAALHFTPGLLDRLAAMGLERTFVELRVGPGTFKPVDTERIEDFAIHAEWASCPPEAVAAIAACRARGGRVIAVGTTVVRTLESAARQEGGFAAWQGWTRLFLRPPERMRVVDGLMTNFHLPRSTLLMLVSCLCGVGRLQSIYRTAVAERYRFYSYGDAMLLLPGR